MEDDRLVLSSDSSSIDSYVDFSDYELKIPPIF